MSFLDLSFEEFTKRLSDKVPTPGGGGASAAVAALGAALCSMAGNYSLGKAKCPDDELLVLLNKAEDLRIKLNKCIDKDAECFEPLSKAYKIPESNPSKALVMEKCLKDAASVPMEIIKLCCEVIDLAEKLSIFGADIMLSDVACSAVFAKAAMNAADVNVKINTKMMNNREYADSLNAESDTLINKYTEIADKVYKEIYQKLK